MDREELKKRVAAEIDRRQDEIIAVADKIWKHPELGFKEFGTAELVGEEFDLHLLRRDAQTDAKSESKAKGDR